MVQIVDNPGFGARFSRALLPALASGASEGRKLQAQKELLGEEHKFKKQAEQDKATSLKNSVKALVDAEQLPKSALDISDVDLLKKFTDYELDQKKQIAKEGRENKLAEEQAEVLGLNKNIKNPSVQNAVYKANETKKQNDELYTQLGFGSKNLQENAEVLERIPNDVNKIYTPQELAYASIQKPALGNALANINNQNMAQQKLDFLKEQAASKITSEDQKQQLDNQKSISKRFEPQIESYGKSSLDAQKVLPNTEVAIVTNELYDPKDQPWDTLIDALPGSFLNQFKSLKGQQLEAYIPIAMASFGQKMGGILTNQKMNLIQKKAIGLGKDKNANRTFLYLDYFDRKLDVLRNEEAQKILSENKPYYLAPADFDAQLNGRMKPYQEMINKDIDRLLNNEKPNSPMSKLGIQNNQQTFQKLPDAQDYTNRTITDSKTGKIFRSNGKTWVLESNG